MLVKDIIESKIFYAEYKIYDDDGETLLWSSERGKLSDELLNAKASYVTIIDNKLCIKISME